MNSGLIANRYAQAFNEYVKAHGDVDGVYGQARVILSAMGKLTKFRLAITDARAVSMDRKVELLSASVNPQSLRPELVTLLELMQRNGRSEFFRLTLLDFLNIYREEHGLVMVQLTTASEQGDLVPLVADLVSRKTGKTAIVNRKVDPDIIGGFIYESWGTRLDASVRRSLDDLHDELIEINRRLV